MVIPISVCSISIKSRSVSIKKWIRHISTGIPGNRSFNASRIPAFISDIDPEGVPNLFLTLASTFLILL